MTGVQTLVPVMLDHVNAGRLPARRASSILSAGPDGMRTVAAGKQLVPASIVLKPMVLGREHGGLGVPVADLCTQFIRMPPTFFRSLEHMSGHKFAVHAVHRVPCMRITSRNGCSFSA